MTESRAHSDAKKRAAGKAGQTEVRLPGKRRLDAQSTKRATEIERSGTDAALRKAARRLAASGKPQKVLQVPQKDMEKAAGAMRAESVKGTVKNMGGTKRKSV